MGNRECYEGELSVIQAIPDNEIITPHHVPIEIYIQESESLFQWALEDLEILVAAGLDPELLEDLPFRCSALAEAEHIWQTQWRMGKNSPKEWDDLFPRAKSLWKLLLKDFRFAFRKHKQLLDRVRLLAKKTKQIEIIKGMQELSELGKANLSLLKAINFDKSVLEEAIDSAAKLEAMKRASGGKSMPPSSTKKIRDQAYTYLKEAVDEIRVHGQYVFKGDKELSFRYRSEFIRQLKLKQREGSKEERLQESALSTWDVTID
jgi:hypothetical protein